MHTNSTSAGGAATDPGVPQTIAMAVEDGGATEGVFEYFDPLPPAFPLDALPNAIRQLAIEGATSIGCPPEFIAGPALVAAAAAIGMSRVVEVTSSHREPPVLFLAVVGEPGTAKSPAEAQALAPTIVRDLVRACRELVRAGQTIVLVEQNIAATLALAERVYMLNNGHIVHEGPAREIEAQPEILRRHLGV